jgi:hypothetical protein
MGAGRGVGRNVSEAPGAIAAGPGGSLYVGDRNGVVRVLHDSSDWETTLAGVGAGATGFAGDGGPAARARLGSVGGVAVDGAGNALITTNDRIRLVAASTGTAYGRSVTAGDIYTIAGGGTGGDGGPATSASLSGPAGLALDPAGNVAVADGGGNRVRMVAGSTGTYFGQAMTAGDIYPVAGTGTSGFAGDGGPATSARLFHPAGVATDPDGNLVAADELNDRIRVVAGSTGTFYGQAMTAGDIYTVAGDGTFATPPSGVPATSAGLQDPANVAADSRGNLIIGEGFGARVLVVAGSTGTFYGQAMAAGDIYQVAGNGNDAFSGEGGPAATASLGMLSGVAVDGAGDIVVASHTVYRVRVVAESSGPRYGQGMAAGNVYTVSGNGLPALSGNRGKAINAELDTPQGLAADSAGDQVIFDHAQIRVVAAATGTFFGQAVTTGKIYALAGTGHIGRTGDGGPATAAKLSARGGVAFDGAGNLVAADALNNRVRVIAASSGTFYGQAMTAGDIYTVAGTGAAGYSGDGGPATAASLDGPLAVAADGAGNIIIADRFSNRIRVVAASPGTFYGQAMTGGDIYTVAGNGTYALAGDGGPAIAAELRHPAGVAVGPAGNIVVADTLNSEIRVIAATSATFYGQAMTAGDIYAVAGRGRPGPSGDGNLGTHASVSRPQGVAVDPSGNVVIADTGNNRIRVVAATSGTCYGVTMTAGHIYTVAGSGVAGYAGDSGPATAAHLSAPIAVGRTPSGGFAFIDSGNSRIRTVSSS